MGPCVGLCVWDCARRRTSAAHTHMWTPRSHVIPGLCTVCCCLPRNHFLLPPFGNTEAAVVSGSALSQPLVLLQILHPPCRHGAVSHVLMSLPLCCWDFVSRKVRENSLVGWEHSLGAVSGNGEHALLVPGVWHSQTSCCYLPNFDSIRAPSLIYCPRSPGYIAELPWGWAGSHVVPKLPLPRNLWVDLHVSSPPLAQLRLLLLRVGDGEMGQLCGRRCPFIPRLLVLLLVTTGRG